MKTKSKVLAACFFFCMAIGSSEAKMIDAQSTLEIISTVNAIGTAADSKDWKKCLAQFDEEVFIDYSALTGIAGARLKAKDLIDAWAKVLGPVHMTQHMITNHEVQISGKDAMVTSYVSAMHSHPVKSGEDYWLLLGKYKHKLRREKEGWKVVSMKLTPTYQSGNKKLLEEVGKENRNNK